MSNVADYSAERAARAVDANTSDLEPGLAAGVEDEMAAALALAAPIPERRSAARAGGASPLSAQWERFRALFVEGMEDGPFSVEKLEDRISAGEVYFWPGREAALVTERVEHDSGAVDLQVLWAVGDPTEAIAMLPGIEATARALGCTGMLVEGRAAWARLLKPHGYAPWSVTVRKEL